MNRPVVSLPTRDIRVLDYRAFQEEALALTSGGARILSLSGSPSSREGFIYLNLIYLPAGGAISLLRSELELSHSYHSLTKRIPSFHCFEREIHEQFGVKWTDHPWLKPIRFEGSRQRKMGDYPFFALEGKEIHEVGVGPIHAGVIEPGHFRFMCYGETVHHLEIQLGYQHRGLERLLRSKNPQALGPWVESIAGDTAIAHGWAFAQAWESVCGVQAPREMDVIRGVALELERIAMHLTGLAGISTDVAFLPGGSTYGRLRTAIINTSMRFCGSRFGRGWIRPGEARCRVDGALLADVRRTLTAFSKDLTLINDLFRSAVTLGRRLHRTGKLATEEVRSLGFVGMVARSTGIPLDLREQLPGDLYTSYPLPLSIENDGDCWSRAWLRVREIDRSLSWIFSALETLEESVPALKLPLPAARANQVAVSLIEGWRGEVLHFIETDSSGQIRHYKVQDPSLRNWFALALSVRNNEISDFPICNKSFDLSYCGNDL